MLFGAADFTIYALAGRLRLTPRDFNRKISTGCICVLGILTFRGRPARQSRGRLARAGHRVLRERDAPRPRGQDALDTLEAVFIRVLRPFSKVRPPIAEVTSGWTPRLTAQRTFVHLSRCVPALFLPSTLRSTIRPAITSALAQPGPLPGSFCGFLGSLVVLKTCTRFV